MLGKKERACTMFPSAIVTIKEVILWEYARLMSEEALGDRNNWRLTLHHFEKFVSEPEIGFHYLGLSNKGHTICTGEIQYLNPESLGLLKEACLKIAKSFRVINLESLGTVILLESYSSLRNILSNKDKDALCKFEELDKQGLIEEII